MAAAKRSLPRLAKLHPKKRDAREIGSHFKGRKWRPPIPLPLSNAPNDVGSPATPPTDAIYVPSNADQAVRFFHQLTLA